MEILILINAVVAIVAIAFGLSSHLLRVAAAYLTARATYLDETRAYARIADERRKRTIAALTETMEVTETEEQC